MKKARLVLAALLVSFAMSACAESPTFPADCVDPGGNNVKCTTDPL